jgi:hypothetical protein
MSIAERQLPNKEIVNSWQQDASNVTAPKEVINWLNFVDSLLGLSQDEILRNMNSIENSWEKRIAAAAVLLSNQTIRPGVLLFCNAFLLTIRKTGLRAELEREVSGAISAAWLILVNKQRFALIAPGFNVPQIVEACKSNKKGWSKVAHILLAACPAVDLTIPSDIMELALLVSKEELGITGVE